MFSANVLQGTRNPCLKGRTGVIRGSARVLISAVNYGEVYGMIFVTMSQTKPHAPIVLAHRASNSQHGAL